jgi:hypothetical protein
VQATGITQRCKSPALGYAGGITTGIDRAKENTKHHHQALQGAAGQPQDDLKSKSGLHVSLSHCHPQPPTAAAATYRDAALHIGYRHCFTNIGPPSGSIQRPNPVRYVQCGCHKTTTARSERPKDENSPVCDPPRAAPPAEHGL